MEIFILKILETSISMTLIIILLLGFNKLLSKWHAAKARYYIWVIVVIGLIIPIRPQFSFSFIEVENPVVETVEADIPSSSVSISSKSNTLPTQATAIDSITANSKLNKINDSDEIPFINIMFFVWLSVGVLIVIYQMIKYKNYMKTIKRWSKDITDERRVNILQHQAVKLKLQGKIPAFRTCSLIQTPMLVGFIKPMILLPEVQLDDDELNLIICHELVHYKRKDLWIKILVLSAHIIHWFNPFIYAMTRSIERDCEESCDQAVLKHSTKNSRKLYAGAILNIASSTGRRNMETVFSTSFSGGKQDMKKRLSAIMNSTKKRFGIAMACCLMILSGTVLSGTIFAQSEDTASLSNNTAVKAKNTKKARITSDEANTIALKKANGGEIQKSKLDRDDDVLKYEIVIKSGNVEHEIDVDATTGKILKHEKEKIKTSKPNQATNNGSNSNANQGQTIVNTKPQSSNESKPKPSTPQTITAVQAQNIALKASGGGVIMKCEYDVEDQEYEIEILNGNVKHDFDINAYSGSIIKHDQDIEDYDD